MKGTIFAVALNHRSQLDAWQDAFQQSPYKAPPKTAVWFIKPRNTVIGCGEPIPFPQGEKVLSGATVALIVGKTATKVREEDAAEYIAGYALANDVSLPEESFYRPAIKAKCRDGFCPIGETVALSNVDNLTIYTEINGRPADHWNTADLQRNAAQLLSALSEFAMLNPGDAILLGTPQTRVEIQPGDRVRVLAEGFPPLENPVVDEREVTTRKSFPTQPHPHGTLFALGLNYADHASELEFKPPEEPLVFLKAPNTLTGDNQTSVRPNNIAYMHYEAELVVVIGKQARNVSEADAMDYVAGYTVCNDYAIRDYLENYYRPNLRVKSRDGLTPMLSTIVPKEAIPDPHNLTLRTFVNGELRQQGTTADLIFSVPFLIAYLSEFMTLNPGDMIATGTPKGLSDVVPGDEVVVEVEGVGRLVNRIVVRKQRNEKVNHWINGKNVAGNDYFQTTNPATGEVLADVASGGEAEINQAVAAAKEAFPKWANLPMKERARLMRRLGDLIDQNVPEIAAMETADTGLPIHQTKNVLIPRASHNFEFFAEVCQQMNGKTYPVDDKMLNYTLVQPVGVCALVSPWNVPFMTATWKVAPCLALGNTAVLKMSELPR